MTRRSLLPLLTVPLMRAQDARYRKSITATVFPQGTPPIECLRKAKEAGFEGVEFALGQHLALDCPPDDALRLRDAAERSGMTVVSLWVSEPLSKAPLNSPSAELRARGVAALRQAIRLATAVGCGALLIVPGRLGNGPKFNVGYEDTWRRVSDELAKVVPQAQEAGVLLTPEEVWNKFLVSPLEMRSFLDEFHSPWVAAHFDIGNVMQYGYPQDWILTLGPRIKRVHVKDYKLSSKAEQGRFVDLWQGDVDWPEVMAALRKVGYRGWMSPEYGYDPGQPNQLLTISKALDHILALG